MKKKILFLTYLHNRKTEGKIKENWKITKTVVSTHAKREKMEDRAEWKVCVITA